MWLIIRMIALGRQAWGCVSPAPAALSYCKAVLAPGKPRRKQMACRPWGFLPVPRSFLLF